MTAARVEQTAMDWRDYDACGTEFLLLVAVALAGMMFAPSSAACRGTPLAGWSGAAPLLQQLTILGQACLPPPTPDLRRLLPRRLWSRLAYFALLRTALLCRSVLRRWWLVLMVAGLLI